VYTDLDKMMGGEVIYIGVAEDNAEDKPRKGGQRIYIGVSTQIKPKFLLLKTVLQVLEFSCQINL